MAAASPRGRGPADQAGEWGVAGRISWKARLGFETKIQRYAPRSIAFLGKRALSTLIGPPDVEWGQHAMGFAGTMAWVLPNPSGLNRRFSLDALVASYSEFRTALLGSSAKRVPVDMIFDDVDRRSRRSTRALSSVYSSMKLGITSKTSSLRKCAG
jgi:hypothetical protein